MIQLRVLGGLAVALSDGRFPSPTAIQPRRLAVLAMLARAGERGLSREKLMAMLWPDADDEAARRGLTQALYALRSGLDAPELCLGVQILRLNEEVLQCDLLEFERAVAEGDLERAAALYIGPFVDGFRIAGNAEFDRWAEEERATLTRRCEDVLELLAQRESTRGNAVMAAKWWRRRAAGDPYNARVTLALMRALAEGGDRAGAVAQARVYESLVQQELGTEPEAGVVALARELRRQSTAPPDAPTASPPAPRAPASTGLLSEMPSDASSGTMPVAPLAIATEVQVPPTAALAHASAVPRVAADVELSRGHPRPSDVQVPRRSRAGLRVVLTVAAVLVAGVGALRGLRDRTSPAGSRVAEPSRVTSDEGLELDAAVSPDGKQVAYAAGLDGEMRIMLRQRTGSRAIAVADGVAGDQRRPRWSPDGTQLLFEAGRALWLVPALGGSARTVVRPPADTTRSARGATWSPDGVSVAWTQSDTVYRQPIVGGRAQTIAVVDNGSALSWSPDGKRIALVSGNPLFQYGDASSAVLRWKGIGNLAPSAIVTVRAECTVGAGGCEPRVLIPPGELNTSPVWLSSSQLVFVSHRGGARDLFVQTLTARGEATGEPRRLTSGLEAFNVSVANDGATFVYSVFRQSSNVWSLPLDSAAALTGPHQVTRGTLTIEGLDARFDGTWLAYDANSAGQQDIYVLPLTQGRAARTDAERVLGTPADDFHPTWSPDGSSIAFYTFVNGVRRAAVVAARGGEPRLVHPTGPDREEHSPTWSADGKTLLYFRGEPGRSQLFESSRRPDGSWESERQVTQHGGLGAASSRSGLLTYISAPGVVRLMPATRDERASRVLYASPPTARSGVVASAGRITPDGARLVIKGFDQHGSGFWTVPITGGAPRLVARLDDVVKPSIRPEFGVDDRFVYYTRVEQYADIWSMRLAP